MIYRQLICIVISLFAAVAPARARSGFCRSGPTPGELHHELQFFAGYSPASATLIGTTKDRKFVAAGFDYSYRCWAWEPVSISFTAGAMPAAILVQPGESNRIEAAAGYAVYGFAITPVGMTMDFGRAHSIFPFFQTNEGVIFSTQRIPEDVPGATASNFLFDLGGGVKWRPGQRHYALTFGYKFLHISNASRTSVNPGVDNNVIYAGYSFLR